MKFSDFLTYFTDTIFRRDVTEWRNPVVRWLVQQYRLLFYTAPSSAARHSRSTR